VKQSNLSFSRLAKGGAAQKPQPSAAMTLFSEGLAHHRAGRLVEAEQIYCRVLETRPDHFDSRHLLGVVFHQRGNHTEALRHFDLALRRDRKNIHALNNRGTALKELHRPDEALESYDRALAVKADYADALSNRGNVLKELKRHDEALESYNRAIVARPDYAEAYSNRGNVLRELKRLEPALVDIDRAIALRPDYAEAWSNRGSVLHALGRFDEALVSYDRALVLQPDFAPAWSNRGNALHELDRCDEALADFDRAVALKPDFAEAHSNRGNALRQLQRFDEALASHDRAIALEPNFVEAHCNRGSVLQDMGRFDEALASYDYAIGIKPDFADARFNAGAARLLAGDFARGWPDHEWRWDIAQLQSTKRPFSQPQWRGSDEIAGKTILIHAEQGLGDTLQFCRYLPYVAERAGHIIFEVQKPLQTLMTNLAGGATIVARGDPLPDFDLHCPLLSLPLAFGTLLESIPAQMPYLSPPEDKIRAWRDRLGKHDRPHVGLVWAGNPRKELPGSNRIDRQRSLTFDRLEPLLDITGCEFFSLQKGDDAVAQIQSSPLRERVTDWTGELTDFTDTAALIENLDLVIAVDTSVAHLAGALAKPFWLLNRYATCWRWLLNRDDSPWYPTARQFRQDESRSWDSVLARMQIALRDYIVSFDQHKPRPLSQA
jgi:tetratricopeptide (TPR) repeat protein